MIPKFRVWDKNHQIMRGVRGLFWAKNNLAAHCSPTGNEFDEFFTTILNDGEYHLMQSTGLFDTNGVEIFEGDVVMTTRFAGRADADGGYYEYEKDYKGVVKMLEGSWLIDTGTDDDYLWAETEENEVVGNIYEHPDLLESVEE